MPNPSLEELNTISDPPIPKLVLMADQQWVTYVCLTTQYKWRKTSEGDRQLALVASWPSDHVFFPIISLMCLYMC